MAHPKPASKRRRRSKALPVLGAAGLSLSLASGASAVPAGPALPTQNTIEVGQNITLGEEEIADVSLATFYVFDKENDGTSGPLQRVGHGCGGCGGHGHAVEAAEVTVTAVEAAEVTVTAVEAAEVTVTAVEAAEVTVTAVEAASE